MQPLDRIIDRVIVALKLFFLIGIVAIPSGIIYIAIHFIVKYW